MLASLPMAATAPGGCDISEDTCRVAAGVNLRLPGCHQVSRRGARRGRARPRTRESEPSEVDEEEDVSCDDACNLARRSGIGRLLATQGADGI